MNLDENIQTCLGGWYWWVSAIWCGCKFKSESSGLECDLKGIFFCQCISIMLVLFWVLNYFFLWNPPRDEKNILEAASNGASTSIGLVANIAANLIAFLAILAFINASLSWFGGMVGYPGLTFQVWVSKTMIYTSTFWHIFIYAYVCESNIQMTFCISVYSWFALMCSCLWPSWWVSRTKTVSLWPN